MLCELCSQPATLTATVVEDHGERTIHYRCRTHDRLSAAEVDRGRWVLYKTLRPPSVSR